MAVSPRDIVENGMLDTVFVAILPQDSGGTSRRRSDLSAAAASRLVFLSCSVVHGLTPADAHGYLLARLRRFLRNVFPGRVFVIPAALSLPSEAGQQLMKNSFVGSTGALTVEEVAAIEASRAPPGMAIEKVKTGIAK